MFKAKQYDEGPTAAGVRKPADLGEHHLSPMEKMYIPPRNPIHVTGSVLKGNMR
jgi:hypothetical protein